MDEEQSKDILDATVKHVIIYFNLFSNILYANLVNGYLKDY